MIELEDMKMLVKKKIYYLIDVSDREFQDSWHKNSAKRIGDIAERELKNYNQIKGG